MPTTNAAHVTVLFARLLADWRGRRPDAYGRGGSFREEEEEEEPEWMSYDFKPDEQLSLDLPTLAMPPPEAQLELTESIINEISKPPAAGTSGVAGRGGAAAAKPATRKPSSSILMPNYMKPTSDADKDEPMASPSASTAAAPSPRHGGGATASAASAPVSPLDAPASVMAPKKAVGPNNILALTSSKSPASGVVVTENVVDLMGAGDALDAVKLVSRLAVEDSATAPLPSRGSRRPLGGVKLDSTGDDADAGKGDVDGAQLPPMTWDFDDADATPAPALRPASTGSAATEAAAQRTEQSPHEISQQLLSLVTEARTRTHEAPSPAGPGALLGIRPPRPDDVSPPTSGNSSGGLQSELNEDSVPIVPQRGPPTMPGPQMMPYYQYPAMGRPPIPMAAMSPHAGVAPAPAAAAAASPRPAPVTGSPKPKPAYAPAFAGNVPLSVLRQMHRAGQTPRPSARPVRPAEAGAPHAGATTDMPPVPHSYDAAFPALPTGAHPPADLEHASQALMAAIRPAPRPAAPPPLETSAPPPEWIAQQQQQQHLMQLQHQQRQQFLHHQQRVLQHFVATGSLPPGWVMMADNLPYPMDMVASAAQLYQQIMPQVRAS